MDVETAIKIADAAVYQYSGQHLKDVEARILRGTLEKKTYTQIFMNESGYSESYIKRDVGPKLWKLLSSALEEPVKKNNLREALKRAESRFNDGVGINREEINRDRLLPRMPPERITSDPEGLAQLQASRYTSVFDWENAPGLVVLHGREEWLNSLRLRILGTRETAPLHLLLIAGAGGMGKTALVRQLAEQVKGHFGAVVWRSLQSPPPLPQFLASLMAFLSNSTPEAFPPASIVSDSLHFLTQHRCLIILDRVESLFELRRLAGEYRPEYVEYRHWFEQLCHHSHASCVILTGREFPEDLWTEGISSGDRVHCLQISNLPRQIADPYLNSDRQLIATPNDWHQLFDYYGDNPEILSRICGRIRGAIWENSVAAFLEHLKPENSTEVVPQIATLLEQQFERLSPLEHEVIYWLAINQGLSSSDQLRSDIVYQDAIDRLPDTLSSLQRRSLITTTDHQFVLSPWMLHYALEQLNQHIVQEIAQERPHSLVRYALIKNNVSEDVREKQYTLILKAIVEQLKKLRLPEELKQKFERILAQFHHTAIEGYGAGNLIHLCQELQVDIEGLDFSNLVIRQVNAQAISLRNTEFKNSSFFNCEWMEPLADELKIVLSHTPQPLELTPSTRRSRSSSSSETRTTFLLAIGDSQGRMRLWRVADAHTLWTETRHRGAVRAIAFSPTDTHLVTLGENDLILWDIRARHSRVLFDASSASRGVSPPILQCFQFHPNGTTLVAGDQAGNLWVCQLNAHQSPIRLPAAASGVAIQSLWFSPDGSTLVCVLADESLKIWNWIDRTCSTRPMFRPNWEIKAIHFTGAQFWAIAAVGQSLYLWDPQSGEQFPLPREHSSEIFALALVPSQSATHPPLLLSSCSENVLKFWDLEQQRCLHSIPNPEVTISELTWSGDGGLIAAAGTNRIIRVWQVERSQPPRLIKTLRGYQCPIQAIALSPDAAILAVGHKDGTIRLRDVSHEGAYLKTLKAHEKSVTAIAFSSDGQTLMSTSDDRTLKQWHWQTGTSTLIRDRLPSARTLVCSSNGALAAIGEDGVLRVWDLASSHPTHLAPHILGLVDDETDMLQFSPDGRWLARVGHGQIQVWDWQQEQRQNLLLRSPLPGSDSDASGSDAWEGASYNMSRIHRVEFSATGDRLVAVHSDRIVWVWTLPNQSLENCQVDRWQAPVDRIHAVFWNRQEELTVLGSIGTTLQLLTRSSGAHSVSPYPLSETPGWVERWCLSGDRRVLAIAHSPDEISLWNLENRYCLGHIRVDQPYERMNITGATFHPDTQAATLHSLGAIRM